MSIMEKWGKKSSMPLKNSRPAEEICTVKKDVCLKKLSQIVIQGNENGNTHIHALLVVIQKWLWEDVSRNGAGKVSHDDRSQPLWSDSAQGTCFVFYIYSTCIALDYATVLMPSFQKCCKSALLSSDILCDRC